MKIATRDFRNYVQYERAPCRMTYTQMIAYKDFVSPTLIYGKDFVCPTLIYGRDFVYGELTSLSLNFHDFLNINQFLSGLCRTPTDGASQSFKLHFWLKSEDEELEFLRKVSEALLLVILPKCHAKSAPIRRLLREVVANASKKLVQ